jgi:hypothetical protein
MAAAMSAAMTGEPGLPIFVPPGTRERVHEPDATEASTYENRSPSFQIGLEEEVLEERVLLKVFKE